MTVGLQGTRQSTVAAGVTTTTTTTYNAADQIVTINGVANQVRYDAAGNETAYPAVAATAVRQGSPARTSTYTSTDQIATHTVAGETRPSSYLQVSDNNLRTGYGSATYQNGALSLSSQKVSNGTITGFTRDPAGTLISARTNGVSQYYLTDNLGSVIGLVDNTGTKTAAYAYDPYGATRTVTGLGGATTTTALAIANANPYRYTGGLRNSDTGLYKLGYRSYDTSQGRFTQQDPSGQEANAYLYAAGDPCNRVDPSGLVSFNCREAIVFLTVAIGSTALSVYSLVGALAALSGATTVVALSAALGPAVANTVAVQLSIFGLATAVGAGINEC